MSNKKTIVVGMSGGVDSSVCAALLKEQGHDVIGLFMKNWEEFDEYGVCQASKEYRDVEKVCHKLNIPCYSVEFIDEYRKQVFEKFVDDYKKGLTPNPDVLCNREIKFDVFYHRAMEMGADFLATGHYCRISHGQAGKPTLFKGVDSNKDQSYFLHSVEGEVFKNVSFPLGEMTKSQVRNLAKKYNLPTCEKKDSTGICFIGERNFKNFLSQFISFHPGEFQNLEGEVVGEHSGASFYTLGQRKGLGLGGAGSPWYVVKKDNSQNIVYVERGEKHPALFCDDLEAFDVSWIQKMPSFPLKCQAKVRYRQKDQTCWVEIQDEVLKVTFERPQRAIAPGQSIVFYNGQECLGGAVIKKTGKSYFEKSKPLPQALVV